MDCTLDRHFLEGYLDGELGFERAEVEAHREVATLLGASGANAPEGLWERIGAEIGATGTPAPAIGRVLSFEAAPRSARRRRAIWLPLGAVAAAVVAGHALWPAPRSIWRIRVSLMRLPNCAT